MDTLTLLAWWSAGTLAMCSYLAFVRGKLTVNNVLWSAIILWVFSPWIIAFHIIFMAMLWLADSRLGAFVVYEKKRRKKLRESGEKKTWD